MYDGKKIIPGLILFVGLVALPLWYNAVNGKTRYVPKTEIPADKKECVEPRATIRINHKDLLDTWMQSVVRRGDRIYRASNGKTYTMDLNRTCMSCHRDKTKFCDQCHNYAGVTNKCWDCHIYPKQVNLSTLRLEGRGLSPTRDFDELRSAAQAEGLEVHPEPLLMNPPSKGGLRAVERVKEEGMT